MFFRIETIETENSFLVIYLTNLENFSTQFLYLKRSKILNYKFNA